MSPLKQSKVIGVIAEPQSYINIFNLLLGLPLGIAYFVFLVTRISVGASLIIIWVGVPILVLVVAGSWAMCEFERILAVKLLKEDIPRTISERSTVTVDESLSSVERLFVGAWRRLKAHLSDRLTWTGMLYLLRRFPVGIASFVVAVTLVSATVSLLGAPFYYWVGEGVGLGNWRVDVLWEALLLALAGIPTVFVALHLMNVTALCQVGWRD